MPVSIDDAMVVQDVGRGYEGVEELVVNIAALRLTCVVCHCVSIKSLFECAGEIPACLGVS